MLSYFSRVWLFAAPWTVAQQAPLSVGFSRQEYWSRLPCPPPGELPNPGIKPTSLMSPALAGEFFTTGASCEAHTLKVYNLIIWLCDIHHNQANEHIHHLTELLPFSFVVRTHKVNHFSKFQVHDTIVIRVTRLYIRFLKLFILHTNKSLYHLTTGSSWFPSPRPQ